MMSSPTMMDTQWSIVSAMVIGMAMILVLIFIGSRINLPYIETITQPDNKPEGEAEINAAEPSGKIVERKLRLAGSSQQAQLVDPVEVRSCHRRDRIVQTYQAPDWSKTPWLSQLFDLENPKPGITFGRCQLSGSHVYVPATTPRAQEFATRVKDLFHQFTAQVKGVTIDPYNLWHCHLIVNPKPHSTLNRIDLSLLFHAFEYPIDGGQNLGYCQVGSTVSVKHPNFRRRNALVHLTIDTTVETTVDASHITILPCPTSQFQSAPGSGVYCTHYAEEFGTEVGELIYLPSLGSAIYFTR